MAGTLRFTKMHGLGNDFALVEDLDLALPAEHMPALAIAMCDRHFGIGGDGVLLIQPSDRADFRMRLFNCDGTEAAHCGNGIRCFAKYLYDRGLHRETRVTVETANRLNEIELLLDGGRVERVRVDMGEPIFARASIPIVGPPESEAIDEPLQVDGRLMTFTALSLGNPHAVTFLDDVEALPLARLGPLVERHAAFPDRVNAEFVQVLGPRQLRMRVWERGAGPTLACGTGACASVVAAARTGRAERRAMVRLDGGELEIEWTPANRVLMTGPAVEVFTGAWPR